MQKGWSLLFGAVLLAELILLIVSPAMGWWLPENIASFGGKVDTLFYVITALTGFFFVLTEGILVYNMYAFTYREGHKSQYVEGNNRLELAWTIVPAAILVYIAWAQIDTWAQIKYQTKTPPSDQVVQVTGRQWEWNMRYYATKDDNGAYLNHPTKDDERGWADSPEIDDLYLPNELHTWKGANVKVFLKTHDVLHSFFLPNLRLKQDALPGKTIPIWFQATEANVEFKPATGTRPGHLETLNDKEFEIACAELCGGFHYRMRGHLYVHKDKASYERWLADLQARERSREPEQREPVTVK